MKSNGALKPRLGASKQGSSPGIVLKEYRVKRYFKLNKNVVNDPPLNACGAKNNFINSTYNSINNQQRAMTSLSLQLKLKEKCGEVPSSDICKSLSRINYSTSIRVTKQIKYSIQDNPKRSRVSEASHNYLNSHKSHYNILQKVTATVAEAGTGAGVEAVAAIKKESEPKGFTNITAHQIDKTEFKEDIVRERNHYSARNERKIRSANKKANKFLFVPKINSNLKVIILRLSSELKLIFVSLFLHAIRLFAHFADNSRQITANNYSRVIRGYSLRFGPVAYNLGKIMRASQLLVSLFNSICLKNAKGTKSPIALFMVIYAATAILLPQAVLGDDGDTFFPLNGIETTTPEFDYASRGQKKFGDKCENTLECGFPGSICDPKKKSCQCTEDLPVTNHIDKCGKEAAVNESCFFNEQCEVKYFQTECRDQRCVCRFDMTPIWLKDGSVECKGRGDKKGPERYIDPAMIGVLIGMALMFIIICVVLRLFSQARWRENRTIFNTPNPRLMNVSLLRESKLLHGQERRGSRMSVRAPSRQPSMASLRPHSPNPSLGSRSNSHGSNASATSLRSTRSNCVSPAGAAVGNNSHHERKGSTYQPQQHKLQTLQQEEEPNLTQTNIISNPVAETVTVEIIEPEKFTKSSE